MYPKETTNNIFHHPIVFSFIFTSGSSQICLIFKKKYQFLDVKEKALRSNGDEDINKLVKCMDKSEYKQ